MSIKNWHNAEAHLANQSTRDRVEELAKRLSEIHGEVVLRLEKHGLHAYMACPKCLAAYGARELRSRHLSLNLDRHLRLGDNLTIFAKKKRGVAMCHKEHGAFTVEDLLCYPPIQNRGFPNVVARIVGRADQQRYLVPDDHGNMIPDHPGQTVPLIGLPSSHPAILYCAARGYDPTLLAMQFGARWCYLEAPEGEQYGSRFYRKHYGGWKSTPQGRLIFYSFINEEQVCWQARYLEISGGGHCMVWHPYMQIWHPRPAWGKGEDPIKYITAYGAFRNSQLCGYDHVVRHARNMGDPEPICVLTEGPLDAARFPNHGMALLGKYLSEVQVQLIQANFKRVILAFDTDKAGQEARDDAEGVLRNAGIRTCRFFTEQEYADGLANKIDAGQLGYQACAERFMLLRNF